MQNIEQIPEKSNKNTITILGKKALAVIAAAGIFFGAVKMIDQDKGGSDSPEKMGYLDSSIKAVELYVPEDATKHEILLRGGSYIGEGENNNVVKKMNAEPGFKLRINTPDGAYISGDKNDYKYKDPNGAYYGIKLDDLEKSVPDLEDIKDNDGVLWVNVQRANIIREDKK
jgi:hypothetical protein